MTDAAVARKRATHSFNDTGSCYNATQGRDDIKFNDLLVIEPEQVVGVLYSAWPTAVTINHGELHSFQPRAERRSNVDGPTPEERAAIEAAITLASEYGWPIDAAAQEMLDE